MVILLRENGAATVAMLGILCATAHLCSSSQAPTSFSFTIVSRRNSTGHRQVKVLFNTPELQQSTSNNSEETRIDVAQNSITVNNRKIVQLSTELVVHEPRVPPAGYELVPGLGWYRLHLTPLTWEEARLACEAEGAHLAVLNSRQEANILMGIFAKTPDKIPNTSWHNDAFIGFSDLPGKPFLTIFGETLKEAGYDTWAPGQPDNAKTDTDLEQDCGGVHRTDGKLNDLPCRAKLAYFCEYGI